MRRIQFLGTLFLLFILLGCESGSEKTKKMGVQLIPKPLKLTEGKGHFELSSATRLYFPEEFKVGGDFLVNFIENGTGFTLKKSKKSTSNIRFLKDSLLPSEGYTLQISKKQIEIKASDAGGAFYASQTLRQLMPSVLETSGNLQEKIKIPVLDILDEPKFSYRGMHLDVGRHFFPKEFIKEYIANMAMLKMNYFHWHLTEDQGWRIEIKQYPRLTKHAAYRDETLIGHYNETPQKFDGKKYGGFYTQEDVKEIVAFAQQHNVTIIPEIEMPGHAQAAISAYPELGCTGMNVPVATKWGVFENIYCPNQKTFVFLRNVLTEVMDLFPGTYIHIGGDEAPKTQWEKCYHCQKLIEELNLGDEHGLQSYFIKEMEAFINSKGKRIIGWDEILEGGLAPNATVMSWRGTEGAVQAAKEGHDVILTPTSHAYFDYYQADHSDEPLAIGGFLPLKKVYSFNPIPPELNVTEAKHVLGAQGNVWTEYMKDEAQVEYMAYPRMLAISEVVWSGASSDMEKDFPDFLHRLEFFTDRMDALDLNYANHLYDISGEVVKHGDSVFYQLSTPIKGKKIEYSTQFSSEKVIVEGLIPITQDTQLEATVLLDGKEGRIFKENIKYHKAITGRITLNVEPHSAYNAGGKEALINGISGSSTRYGDKEWLGFWGDDVEVTIDLGEERAISSVSTRFYNANGQWIYAPKKLTLFGSKDGDAYAILKEVDVDDGETLVTTEIKIRSPKVRFIKLRVPSYGDILEGRQGAGNKAWTFMDEIIIE